MDILQAATLQRGRESPPLLPSFPLFNSPSQRSSDSLPLLNGGLAEDSPFHPPLPLPLPLDPVCSFLTPSPSQEGKAPPGDAAADISVRAHGDNSASGRNKRSFLSFLLDSPEEEKRAPTAPPGHPQQEAMPQIQCYSDLSAAQELGTDFFGLDRSFTVGTVGLPGKGADAADAAAYAWQQPGFPPAAPEAPAYRGPSPPPAKQHHQQHQQQQQEEDFSAADFLDFFKSSGKATRAEGRPLSGRAARDAGSPVRALSHQTQNDAAGAGAADPALAISLLSSAALSLGIAVPSLDQPQERDNPSHSHNPRHNPSHNPSPSHSPVLQNSKHQHGAALQHSTVREPEAAKPLERLCSSTAAPPAPPSGCGERRPKKRPKLQDLVLFWLKGQKFFNDLQVAVAAEGGAGGEGGGAVSPLKQGESVGSQSKGAEGGAPSSPTEGRGERSGPSADAQCSLQEHCGESGGGSTSPNGLACDQRGLKTAVQVERYKDRYCADAVKGQACFDSTGNKDTFCVDAVRGQAHGRPNPGNAESFEAPPEPHAAGLWGTRGAGRKPAEEVEAEPALVRSSGGLRERGPSREAPGSDPCFPGPRSIHAEGPRERAPGKHGAVPGLIHSKDRALSLGSEGPSATATTSGEDMKDLMIEEALQRRGAALKRSPLSLVNRADSLRSEQTQDSEGLAARGLKKGLEEDEGLRSGGESGNLAFERLHSLESAGRITPRSMVEKKRRERISIAFAGLKEAVNVQGDMAYVLVEAARVIKEQQTRLQEYHEKELMERLRKDMYKGNIASS